MLQPFPFSELRDWYLKNGRSTLPWRDYSHDTKTLGYRVWLAETMLQQTQVERVKEYFKNILTAFPTVEDLAACSYEEFFPYYKWLGYYSRARNMLAAAKQVVDDFWGIFPEDTQSLRTLKWVGPYTAEAIRAFAYNESTLSFDTNLEKIFSRYYYGNKFQKLTKDEKSQILADFQKQSQETHQTRKVQERQDLIAGSVQKSTWPKSTSQSDDEIWSVSCVFSGRDINNALMDYGATISLNSIASIDWDSYPLHSSTFYQTRWELEPVKEKKKSSFPNKQAYVLAILHENHKKYFSLPVIPANAGICQQQPKKQSEAKTDPATSAGWHNSFRPFLIGKNTWNPRAITQEYFLKNFWLEVSVRPPEVKSYNKHEIPYMVCYVQVQSGKHSFSEFEGLKVRGFEEGYVEGVEFGDKWEKECLNKHDYFEVEAKQNSLF